MAFVRWRRWPLLVVGIPKVVWSADLVSCQSTRCVCLSFGEIHLIGVGGAIAPTCWDGLRPPPCYCCSTFVSLSFSLSIGESRGCPPPSDLLPTSSGSFFSKNALRFLSRSLCFSFPVTRFGVRSCFLFSFSAFSQIGCGVVGGAYAKAYVHHGFR